MLRQSGRFEVISASMTAPCGPFSIPAMFVPESARREAISSAVALTSTNSFNQLYATFMLLSGSFQVPEVDLRGVIHPHAPIYLVFVKKPLQFFHHRLVIRVTFFWRVRTAPQSSGKSLEIEVLKVGKLTYMEILLAEKPPHRCGLRVCFSHLRVIHAKANQQVFIFASKSCFRNPAIIPRGDNEATRLQDAAKFTVRRLRIEPMKRLPRADEINRCIAESRAFRRAIDTGEFRIFAQKFLAPGAHLWVRFDTENRIATFQEKFAQKPRA